MREVDKVARVAKKAHCVCGKLVSMTVGGRPYAHACTADVPTFANPEDLDAPAEPELDVPPLAPSTGETGLLSGEGRMPTGAFEWNPNPGFDRDGKPMCGPVNPVANGGRDDQQSVRNRITGYRFYSAKEPAVLECGHPVSAGAPVRERPEGGRECRGEYAYESGTAVPSCMLDRPDTRGEFSVDYGMRLVRALDDAAENWNGTGRPRPSAATVKMPEPAPQEDKPRLLDMLRDASAGAGTVLDVVSPQSSAALDEFVSPTPQGSGPSRGAAPATHTGVPAMHSGAAPDPFTSPTHVAPPLGSATDQPETERDRYGRYLIKDPRTGDFKRNRRGTPEGFTRATTYGKTLLDQFGIHQWEMRSVLAGLALRPDLVARAQGLKVDVDKDILNAITAEAKDAAGGNEAADDGTEFHTVTEWIDAGKMRPEDAPEKFRAEALAYAAKMAEAGLSTEFGWIERVTFTDRGGEDVAGTADRILRERNGQLVVGDVKSGKGIDLAQREIAIQLKVYAMGINQFGLYNKATKTWEPWTGPPVSEEYGIVMHVPVVRPEDTEAYCDLYRIDLRGVAPYEVQSAMHAAAWTREWRKQKGFTSPYHAPAVQPVAVQTQPTRTWAQAFASVTTPEEANRLWQAARDAGMDDTALSENVTLARRALESRS